MKIISRAEAKQLGLTHYFTGKPCKHGHVDKRYVDNSRCFTCLKLINYTRRDRDNKFKREYYKSERGKSVVKQYRDDNRERINNNKREYYYANHEKCKEQKRRDHAKHRDARILNSARYRRDNKDALNAYYRERRSNDLDFKINAYMRNMIGRIVQRGYNKDKPTCEILGYDNESLKLHLTNQFTEGMSWDNYGEWHIDHIVPVSWWISQGITDPSIINTLENLQPLWAVDNLSKGAKIE